MTLAAPANTPHDGGGGRGSEGRSLYDLAKTTPSFGVMLFLTALAPRLYVALAWAGEPVWDGHYYDFGARRIAEGVGYSDDRMVDGITTWHPWCHYPVGYSAFLGLFYRVFGATHTVAHVVDAVTGALLAIVTWRLAARALSETRARIAGVIVALYPGLLLYAGLVMTEPLAALLTLTSFWIAARDTRWRSRALAAFVLGLSALVRPTALLCAPLLALFGRSRGEHAPVTLARAAILCVLTLVPVLPWTARNCRVMDGCALVSTNAGWNLAIGAFPRATGRFETLRSSDGCREVTGQVQQDRCWLEYGIAEIQAHPAHWLALIPAKLSYTFDHESFAVEYLREARPDDWPEPRRVHAREITTVLARLLACAAVFGAVALRLRGARVQAILAAALVAGAYLGLAADSPTVWPLVVACALLPWAPLPGRPGFPPVLLACAGYVLSVVVTHAIFFGEDRYHVVIIPALAIFAAAAFRPPARRA